METEKKEHRLHLKYLKEEIQGALNLLLILIDKEKKLESAIQADDRKSGLEKINNNIKIQWLLELAIIQENLKNIEGQIRNLKFNY